jgi:hypothetical protein
MAALQELNNGTYNCDIDGIVRRINRAIVEMTKSQSGGVSLSISFDVIRWRTYIQGLTTYVDYITSQPQLDLPETHPLPVPLPAKPVIPMMENESAYDMAQLFDTMREEIANSQSSRMPSGLISHDELRIRSYLQRATNFINEYITVIDPLDLPDSSPMAPAPTSGSKGV